MTSKTKKKRSDPLFISSRHHCSPLSHPTHVRATIAFVLAVSLTGASVAARPAPRFQSSSSGLHTHDFLIFTTVFTDRGFALFGARTRLRRAERKKFRWEAVSDHSGEFAFRIPQGAEYEMTVEARGFKTQTRKIDARDDIRAELTIRMEPVMDSPAAPPAEPHAEPTTGGKP
jgi:hypothetical protein